MPGVEVRGAAGRAARARRSPSSSSPARRSSSRSMKDPLKTKGARLSMQLSIAGRYLVYVPQGEGVGVSRRLGDKERDRLRKEAKGLDLQGGGAIIRTAASGAKKRGLRARDQVPLQALRDPPEARRRDAARRRWSSRRPTSRCASCATSSRPSSSARSSTTRSSTSGSTRSSPGPRRSCSTASSSTRTSEPLFERYGLEEAIRRCSTGAWTCPRAAT